MNIPLKSITCAILVSLSSFLAIISNGCDAPKNAALKRQGPPQRVIATSPSIAETLYALGLGDRIVGVSRFCHYPPEVENVTKIGGLLDRDDEAMLRLEPDLIIELEENLDACKTYRKFGIEVLTVDHKTVDGLFESFLNISEHFGPEIKEKAETLCREMKEELEIIKKRTQNAKAPRVLISADRERGSGRLLSVYLAGDSPYYEDILRYAGGINVASGSTVPYPLVSVEEIVRMNPEVIIDLCTVPSSSDTTIGKDDWNVLGDSVEAIRNNRVYVFTEDYTTIPGPRLPQTVRRFAEALHPEEGDAGVPAK